MKAYHNERLERVVTYGLFLSCALYMISILNFGRGLTHSPILTEWVQPRELLPVFLYLQLPLAGAFVIFLLLKLYFRMSEGHHVPLFPEEGRGGPDWSRRAPLIAFTLLAVCAFLVWWFFMTRGYFFWDDHEHVPWVRYLSNPLAFLWDGNSPGKHFRPVVWLLFWIDYKLWGVHSASGYYALSAIIHFLNAIMIYILGRSIINRRDIPLMASLIFFFLPVPARSNFFLVSRDGTLQMLFCMLSLCFLNLYLLRERPVFYVLSLFSFLFSIMSKEHVIVFPLLIIAFDLFWGKKRAMMRRLIEYIPYWCLAALFMIHRTLVLGHLGHISDASVSPTALLLNYFLRIPRAYFIFDEVISGPRLLFFPWRTILMTVVVISLLAISFKKSFLYLNKLGLFALVWMIIFQLPVSLFDPWNVHLYPQSIGFCYLLASLLDMKRGKLLRGIQYALFSMLIGLFATRSYELMMDPEQDYDLVRGPLYRKTINAIDDFMSAHYPQPGEETVYIFVMEDPGMWRYVSDRYIKTVLGRDYYANLFLPAALPGQGGYFHGRRCLQQTMLPLNLRRYAWINPDDPVNNLRDDDGDGRIDNFVSMSPHTKEGRVLENLPVGFFRYPPERYSGAVCAFIRPAVESLDMLMANDWNQKVLYLHSDYKIEVKYDPSMGIDNLPPEWLDK